MATEPAPTRTASGSDQAILARLQERMDRIIRGDAPNTGRFCGWCFARVDEDERRCGICGTATDAVAPVGRVPRAVLRVYNAHLRKMRLWVNLFAFGGILLAIVLTGLMIALLPSPWNFLAAVSVIFTSWYLANLMGGGIGAAIGSRRGAAARDAKWAEFNARRAAGDAVDAR